MSLRIAQISDLHLFQNWDGVLAGIRTWDTFRAVLDLVNRQRENLDYLIITGDLAQDGACETYLMLREVLGDWLHRCRIIPGNHDDRDNLREVFPEMFPISEGPLTFSLQYDDWRVIGLDSQIPGQTNGRIDTEQLEWLRATLASAPDCQALLFVHHPPIPIDVAWIDELGLDDAAEFVEFIESSSQIKVICAGHVHQDFAGEIGTSAMFTTPSTCVQFGSRSEKSFDPTMAGFRSIVLGNNGYLTKIHRLSE